MLELEPELGAGAGASWSWCLSWSRWSLTVEPELAEELDEPDEVELDPLDVLVFVEPGRARASAPAVTTLAMVTAVVVDRTLARPRSLAATAWRIPSSRRSLSCPSSCGPVLGIPARTLWAAYEPGGSPTGGPRLPANMKDT